MAIEHRDEDLSGSRFERVDLTGSAFTDVRLRDARITDANLSGVELRDVLWRGGRIRGVEMLDVEITGELENVTVNGVEIGPLVDAELARRYPEYGLLRPTTAAGLRAVWPVLEEQWDRTVARARTLAAHDPDLLHESVDGEWSFIETLRHMLFVTDSWVRRGLLGDPRPWHALDLPWDQMPDTPGVPRDRAVRPGLDDVLAVRADRQAGVRDYLATLTDEQLAGSTVPVEGPGWPPVRAFPVTEPLHVLLNEEWWHRRFAERDLAVLARRAGIDLGAEDGGTAPAGRHGDRGHQEER
ncbi:DinB family protein [Actinotalea sp. M2MS4P-6]|uniref:DinB family protein n=1 Tax=Actinotalea sp. M2MS4P-6 TaxID=2983762 RepID=UPI0021E45D22|nr:DinB family protein [Actinotalea sp. M2MS4P-6]MCV2393323.1 DinB family protein [Actinotalea sp. M2MS4P-6]